MNKLRTILCFSVCTFSVVTSAFCLDVDLPAILREVATAQRGDAIEIEYELTDQASPSKLSADQIEARVAEYKEMLGKEMDVEEVRAHLDGYRKSLTQGESVEKQGSLILSKDFFACSHQDGLPADSPSTTWQIRQGKKSYIYSEPSNTVILNEEERITREGHGDAAFNALGNLGGLSAEIISSLKEAKVAMDQGQITLTGNPMRVRLAPFKGKLVVTSVGFAFEDRGFATETVFKDYQDFEGIVSPSVVVTTVKTKAVDLRRSYRVKRIAIVSEPQIPILSRDVGYCKIFDQRFSPPISYFALNSLPDDAQVAEWVSNPKALMKYNEALEKLRK